MLVGEKGRTGSAGDRGLPGLNGPDGDPGTAGRKGQPGVDGLPGKLFTFLYWILDINLSLSHHIKFLLPSNHLTFIN